MCKSGGVSNDQWSYNCKVMREALSYIKVVKRPAPLVRKLSLALVHSYGLILFLFAWWPLVLEIA